MTERLSSPMSSQAHSSASSKADRNNSSKAERDSSGLRQYQLTNESSTHSHGDESRRREELNVIRTLAEVHCLLAEVRINNKHCSRDLGILFPSVLCTN